MTVPSGDRTPNTKFRAARLQLDLSQDGLAQALREAGWTSCDTRTIQRYERGESTRPQYVGRRALPQVLKKSLLELGFPPEEDQGGNKSQDASQIVATAAKIDTGHDRVAADSVHVQKALTTEGEPDSVGLTDQILEGVPVEVDVSLDRRRLLQAMAALGVATSPAADALSEIQSMVGHTLTRDERLHLDEWEEIVAEYGYTYTTLPSHVLMPEIASDLISVRKVLSRTRSGDPLFGSWCRIAGGLAVLMAKVLSDMGRRRDARMWWLTAKQAADAARDRDLGVWVEAERLVYGIYERRPTPVLLRRADEIAELANTSPGRGLAHLRTVRSQLLALEGHDDAALAELDRSREVFEHLPAGISDDAGSLWGWSEYRLRYTETWVFAYLGLPQPLDVAADRACFLQSSPRGRAQLNLLRAFGYVKDGDLSEGIRHATAIYEAHPADQRTVMVNSLAELVLQGVPADRQQDPAVSGYRDLVASGSQRRAIT